VHPLARAIENLPFCATTARQRALGARLRLRTEPNTERLMTDENPAYIGIADDDNFAR
jgi:hypothetical protein